MTDDLIIESHPGDSVGILNIVGSVGLHEGPHLLAAVATALQDSPHRAVVCQLSGLTVTHDASLAAFPAGLRRAGGWPVCALHLVARGGRLESQFAAVRMHRFLPVHASLADALVLAEAEIAHRYEQLVLQSVPESVKVARSTLGDLWPAYHLDGRTDAMTVVDELVANAVQHVARPFTLSLTLSSRRLLVAVTDPSQVEPMARQPELLASGGRGLRLVSKLSQDWGVRLVHPTGKTVWAQLPPPGAPLIPRGRVAAD